MKIYYLFYGNTTAALKNFYRLLYRSKLISYPQKPFQYHILCTLHFFHTNQKIAELSVTHTLILLKFGYTSPKKTVENQVCKS